MGWNMDEWGNGVDADEAGEAGGVGCCNISLVA